MTTRRRPSVTFHDAPLPPPPAPLALTVSPPPPPLLGLSMPAPTHHHPQQQQPADAEQQWAARRLLSRLRGLPQQGPVPLPLVFMALGMASVVRPCMDS